MEEIRKEKENDDKTLLRYRLIDSSSEDPDHPLYEIARGQKGPGWQSTRFCQYPQNIIIQFNQPVNLKQISILIHEKNIPSQIKFYIYKPTEGEFVRNYKQLPYTYAGFIKMDTNTRSNFMSREFRKVYLDLECLYIKLELYHNYINKFNIFNQVGIVSIQFYGNVLPAIGSKKQNKFVIDESVKPQNVTDEDLDGLCGDKLSQLKGEMEENIKLEKYDECKIIKAKIERVRLIAKNLYDLEYKKKLAVNNEDFDVAKDLKNLADKMRVNLANVDKMFLNGQTLQDPTSNEEQPVGPKGAITQEGTEVTENIHENIQENIEDTTIINPVNNTTVTNDPQNVSQITKLNQSFKSNNKVKLSQEDFVPYDDIIVPTVYKKLNNTKNENLDEDGAVEKGPLEDLDQKTLSDYAPLIKYIGEDGLRKIFSKQILWKEEGFDIFLEKMPQMFKSPDNINLLTTLIMKMVMVFLDEKHPSIVTKTVDIVRNLLDSIKVNSSKLNIDLNITDSMLTKIKSKLSDVNPKVRKKTVELYCYMLTLDFCDYNNLISELVESELRFIDSNPNIKYVPKSSKLIMGKLEIFQSVLDDFQDAVAKKRTDMDSFPYSLVANYLILNVSHSKSEVRKMTRKVIGKLIKVFGVKRIKKKLEQVEQRELAKLVDEIPELKEAFPHLNNAGNTSIDMGNGALNQSTRNARRSRSKSNKKTQKSPSPKSEKYYCTFCKKEMPSKDYLPIHWAKECRLFTNCPKCKDNIEVKKLTNHCLNDCKFKGEFVRCKRCKEAIPKEVYEKHSKDFNCNPAKNINSSNRCPLCHQDIPPTDKGFFTHLVVNGCKMQTRK